MAPSAVTIGLELDVPLPTEPFVLSILAAATAAVPRRFPVPASPAAAGTPGSGANRFLPTRRYLYTDYSPDLSVAVCCNPALSSSIFPSGPTCAQPPTHRRLGRPSLPPYFVRFAGDEHHHTPSPLSSLPAVRNLAPKP
jgi:hypothetical protein